MKKTYKNGELSETISEYQKWSQGIAELREGVKKLDPQKRLDDIRSALRKPIE